ncbi:hypothetical protein [Streptomyces sp. NPDC058985]|uniref:hypothetical protein n=1 Tax=Streptomyces sp. NPDC058985 TaxID=3346684 RepID=UPI00368BD63A
MLTISEGVLLAVIIVVRLRRRTQARSRNDEKLSGADRHGVRHPRRATAFGQGVLDVVGQFAAGINDSSR